MTAPSPKVTLTPEIYAYFSMYFEQNSTWGIYHVALSDGGYKHGANLEYHQATDEDRKMAALFDQMTPSQRARIKKRCER